MTYAEAIRQMHAAYVEQIIKECDLEHKRQELTWFLSRLLADVTVYHFTGEIPKTASMRDKLQ